MEDGFTLTLHAFQESYINFIR